MSAIPQVRRRLSGRPFRVPAHAAQRIRGQAALPLQPDEVQAGLALGSPAAVERPTLATVVEAGPAGRSPP